MFKLPPDTPPADLTPSVFDRQRDEVANLTAGIEAFNAALAKPLVGETQVIRPTDPTLELPWVLATQVTNPDNINDIYQRTFHVLSFPSAERKLSRELDPPPQYQTDILYRLTAPFCDRVYGSNGEFIRWAQTDIEYRYSKVYKHNKVASDTYNEQPSTSSYAPTAQQLDGVGDQYSYTDFENGGVEVFVSVRSGQSARNALTYRSPRYVPIMFACGQHPGAIVTCNAPHQVYLVGSKEGHKNPPNGPAVGGAGVERAGDRGATPNLPAPVTTRVILPDPGRARPDSEPVDNPILLLQPYLLVWADVAGLDEALSITIDWYGEFLYTEIKPGGHAPKRVALRHAADTPLPDRLLPPGNVPVRTDFPPIEPGVPVSWVEEDAGFI